MVPKQHQLNHRDIGAQPEVGHIPIPENCHLQTNGTSSFIETSGLHEG
jgi:hypothetical protein